MLTSTLTLLAAIAAAVIFHTILFWILRQFAKRSSSPDFPVIVRRISTPTLFLLILMAIYPVIPMVEIDTEAYPMIRHAMSILMICLVAWLIIKSITVARYLVQRKYDVNVRDNLKARRVHTLFRVLERILIFVVVVIAVATALMTFETIRQVGISLLASAGIAGIIVGFAAQKTLATLLAGLQIAITQPIRLDDVVIVEDEWGRIEEITLTYVVVRIWDKRRLVIPTTYFIENSFQNWTRISSDILGTVFLHLDYRVPVEKIREELNRLVQGSEFWDQETAIVQVTEVTEKTVVVRCLMGSPDASMAWNLRVFVREKMIEYLQENYPDSLPHTRVILNNENQLDHSD